MTAPLDFFLPGLPPCIDTRVGLASTNGNEALYRRLLRMFGDGQHDAVERFRAAQARGDDVGAMRVVHNLRTSASTLGMAAIGEVALSLELACREGAADPAVYAALLDELAGTLEPALRALGAARENPRPTTLSGPIRSD